MVINLWFIDFLDWISTLPKIMRMVVATVISAIPVLEQKAGIPISMGALNLGGIVTYIFTLIGAVLPAPLILFFMPKLFNLLKRHRFLGKFVIWYENRAIKKGKNIVKYELLGLFFFVAIPLPLTGVWTGTTVAALLNLDTKKSLITVLLGAAVCGIIIMLVYKGAISLFWM
jgi:uncharacterized membrane protein